MEHEMRPGTSGVDGTETGGAGPAAGPPRGKRRPSRLLRVALVLALLLGALLVLGPPLLARWARGQVERAAAERVDGTVRIGALHLSLNGKVHVEDVVVEDRAGRAVLRVPSTRFDVGLRSLLGGRNDVALKVEGLHLELVREEDGRWNVDGLLRPDPDGPGPGEESPGDPLPGTPPDLEGRLELLGATIVVRSPDTALELRDIDLRVGLDGDQREYSVEGGARLAGGDGSAGRFVLDGALWPDAGPGVRLDDVGVVGLELGAVQEALALLGTPLEEGSRLAGTVDLHVSGTVRSFAPDAALVFEGAGVAHDLDLEVRSGGQPLFAFDDRETRLDLSLNRQRPGEEPALHVSLHGRDGKVTVDGGWDGAADEAVRVLARVDGVEASAGLEPLLARVHPVFAGARSVQGAGVDGAVNAEVSVVYGAPLPLARLAAGPAALDTSPLTAAGSLSVSGGMVHSSPLVEELLTALGRPADPTFDLAPLGFVVDDGLVRYASPWTWTIEGVATRFEGGVGLDGGLALRWVVPVTERLAGGTPVLEELVGETFEVPLSGTLTAPRLDVAGALTSLAREAGERALRRELERQKDALGDEVRSRLDDVLGEDAGKVLEGIGRGEGAGAVEEAARGVVGAGKDAAALLAEADRLWKAGQQAEAKPLYARLRKDFALSPAYLLNKKRIKERAGG